MSPLPRSRPADKIVDFGSEIESHHRTKDESQFCSERRKRSKERELSAGGRTASSLPDLGDDRTRREGRRDEQKGRGVCIGD